MQATMIDVTPDDLRAAADRFAVRTDDFAAGKSDTCHDLADKLERYGSFVSERQAEFAAKLVSWSMPRAPRAAVGALMLPGIVDLVMHKNLSLHLGNCKLTRFGSGVVGLVSPVFGAGTFGVIEADGTFKRFRQCTDEMVAKLRDVEARGVEAVKEIGRATGRCVVCSRMLTDPASIEAGIGPICASKF